MKEMGTGDESTPPVLDHVVLAARSLADIDGQLAALGLRPGSRRAIPGAGLSNVVVAVGTQLLEIHYPDGSAVAPGAPPYARVQEAALGTHPGAALVPVAWLVRFGTEAGLRAASGRVGRPVMDMPAEPPNGTAYLLGGFGAAFERPWLPAFIHWSPPPHLPPPLVDDRDRGPNDGRVGLEVSGPEDELADWCGGLPPDVDVRPGSAGPLRVWLHRPGSDPVPLGLPPSES